MNRRFPIKVAAPAISTETMRKVDRLMAEEFGIQLIQMMENAGRTLAELVRHVIGGSVAGKHIAVAVGRGNNGGGGLVAARHLSDWGAGVQVLAESDTFSGIPEKQWRIVQKLPVSIELGLKRSTLSSLSQADVIVDALIGYGIVGPATGWPGEMIEVINTVEAPTLALDTPSGLNTTTGEAPGPCVHAKATMTLALPKIGLLAPRAKEYVGEMYLADIGVPPVLYEKLGIAVVPLFDNDHLVMLK